MGRLIALILAGLIISVASLAAEPFRYDTQLLTPNEQRDITKTLERLAESIKSEDTNALRGLLSSKLSESTKSDILQRFRAEFGRIRYSTMIFSLTKEMPIERLSKGELLLIAVRAEYEYAEKKLSDNLTLESSENTYSFLMTKEEGSWQISGSSFFDQLTPVTIAAAVELTVGGAFFALLLLLFWGWMALDALSRYGQLRYAILIVLSTPIGAGVYFFAIFIRAKPH